MVKVRLCTRVECDIIIMICIENERFRTRNENEIRAVLESRNQKSVHLLSTHQNRRLSCQGQLRPRRTEHGHSFCFENNLIQCNRCLLNVSVRCGNGGNKCCQIISVRPHHSLLKPPRSAAKSLNCARSLGERHRTLPLIYDQVSPVTSKPANRDRIKTGHVEVLNSYQVS